MSKTTKVKTIAAKGKLGEKRNCMHITTMLISLTMMGIWKARV
jgi:hypothetical protein